MYIEKITNTDTGGDLPFRVRELGTPEALARKDAFSMHSLSRARGTPQALAAAARLLIEKTRFR